MEYYEIIRDEYRISERDTTKLFQIVLSAADEIGFDGALEILERCVNEKWAEWLDNHLTTMERSGDPLKDGYRIFYEEHMGISRPKDGEEVEATDNKLVLRWWVDCLILETCKSWG